MERPFDAFDRNCPSRQVVDDVVDRWPSLVLISLLDTPLRFAETARTVGGISDRMLSRTLTQLTHDGFVRRLPSADGLQVRYELTDIGDRTAVALKNVVTTIYEAMPEIMRARAAAT